MSGASFVLAGCMLVSAVDGDTADVQCPQAGTTRVRLQQSQAPERNQPGGAEATAALERLCRGQPAVLTLTGRKSYGRPIGRLRCAGVDADEALVRDGYSWAYRPEASPAVRLFEVEARMRRVGIWGSSTPPIDPGEWRKTKRQGR